MPTNNAPFSPERSASPEGQALDIRLHIIDTAERLFSQLPYVEQAVQLVEQPTPNAPRKLTNPLLDHYMNQPELGQNAYDIIDEIYGKAA